MSGGRKPRRGGARGGGRGTGGNGGYGAGGQPHGGGAPQNPVEFYLYASEQFPMEQCPAQLKPAAADGAMRLSMPIREHLGDIIAWFSAMAPKDPTSRLVVCQATKADKAWLQAFAKGLSAELQYSEEPDKYGNKLLQFSLVQPGPAAPVPPPPPPTTAKQEQPAAAAGAQQPVAAAAAAASTAKEAVAGAAQHTVGAVTQAAHEAGEVAAAVGGQAKQAASAAVAQAQEAGKAASSSVAAAAQQAGGGAEQGTAEGSNQARTWSWSCGSSWFEGAQAAVTGRSGPSVQLVAVGGIALAVTTIVLGVVLGGKRRSRA